MRFLGLWKSAKHRNTSILSQRETRLSRNKPAAASDPQGDSPAWEQHSRLSQSVRRMSGVSGHLPQPIFSHPMLPPGCGLSSKGSCAASLDPRVKAVAALEGGSETLWEAICSPRNKMLFFTSGAESRVLEREYAWPLTSSLAHVIFVHFPLASVATL